MTSGEPGPAPPWLGIGSVDVTHLWFGPGDPVRAASGVARFEDGWLIAQDDANHAAWWRPDRDSVERVRLFPPRNGRDLFDEASGTKHLKPDLEAACVVEHGDRAGVLLLGSGSLQDRTRVALVYAGPGDPEVVTADLGPVYERVRAALGIEPDQLNLEGACVVGDRLRWFQRGHGRTQVASASVDLELVSILGAIQGVQDPAAITPGAVRRYDLGDLAGLQLAITDAVALPDGRIVASATAEDAPDAVADGPVAGSVLALLDDDVSILPLPDPLGEHKVEGLAVVEDHAGGFELLAVVDQDDPQEASLAVRLTLRGEAIPEDRVARGSG